MKFLSVVFTTALLVIAGCEVGASVDDSNEVVLHGALAANVRGPVTGIGGMVL